MRLEMVEAAITSLIGLLPASKRTSIDHTCSVTKPARSDEPGMLGRETGKIGGVYKERLISDQPNYLLICL